MRHLQAARGAPLSSDDPADGVRHHSDNDHDDDHHDHGGDHREPAPVPALPRRAALLLATAAVALALDVVTKVLVVARLEGEAPLELLGGRLLLRVTRNPGAAFSFAEGATIVFTLIAASVVVVILWVSRRVRSGGWALALGLLLGGAAGNLVDRLLRDPGPGRGAVVDFIDFQVWPSFNIADSGVVCGGVLAVLLSLRGIELDGRRDGRAPKP